MLSFSQRSFWQATYVYPVLQNDLLSLFDNDRLGAILTFLPVTQHWKYLSLYKVFTYIIMVFQSSVCTYDNSKTREELIIPRFLLLIFSYGSDLSISPAWFIIFTRVEEQ